MHCHKSDPPECIFLSLMMERARLVGRSMCMHGEGRGPGSVANWEQGHDGG